MAVTEPEYAPVAVVLEIGNDPPSVKVNAPAPPSAPLSVQDPPHDVLFEMETVSEPPPSVPVVIEIDAGTVRVNICPPSPLTVKVGTVEAGDASQKPFAGGVRAPVGESVTVPDPLVGRTIFPNDRPLVGVWLIEIGRTTVAVSVPVAVTAPAGPAVSANRVASPASRFIRLLPTLAPSSQDMCQARRTADPRARAGRVDTLNSNPAEDLSCRSRSP